MAKRNMKNVIQVLKRKVKYRLIKYRLCPDNLKVNFIICGTQKGGTTALYEYLRVHPQICMANEKEIHFFDNESMYQNDKPDYKKYHSFFSPKRSHKLLGEATPIYMYWRSSPKRIFDYNQNIKLIIILRNPIERAYSHWNMERSKNLDRSSFWDAIQNEQKRCEQVLPLQHRVFSYIDRGFYQKQLRRLRQYFSREQMLILKNEHLRNEPRETLRNVCDFLGVTHFNQVSAKCVHSTNYAAKMSTKEREFLHSVFESEIRGIELALGWDCSDWLSK